MTVLNCSVKNCYYNKNSKCCRDGISVGGTDATIKDATYCGDFKEKKDSVTAKSEHCDCGLFVVHLMIIVNVMPKKLL